MPVDLLLKESLVAKTIFPKILKQDNITCLSFEVMKLIPAVQILKTALAKGDLKPGGTIVEISSGTFALALALVAKASGFRLRIITIDIDAALLWRLQNLGADVHVVKEPDENGSIQGAQIALLNRFREADPGIFWCQQYENPNNPASYEMLGEYLEECGISPDVLVGTVGTGGSMTGTAKALRGRSEALHVVGVDSLHSVSFGAGKRNVDPACSFYMDQMLGLGSRVQMKVLDHTEFDEVHWLPFRQMVMSTHELHRNTGLMMGPTSGAAYHVARWIASERPDDNVAVILPDNGLRYINTVYARDWINALGLHGYGSSLEPQALFHPADADRTWSSFAWQRRSMEDVDALAAPVAA